MSCFFAFARIAIASLRRVSGYWPMAKVFRFPSNLKSHRKNFLPFGMTSRYSPAPGSLYGFSFGLALHNVISASYALLISPSFRGELKKEGGLAYLLPYPTRPDITKRQYVIQFFHVRVP